VSRFEVTTCDSCGVSDDETQLTEWAEVVFWGLKEPRRLYLCPQCAAYVAGFIEEGCERDYKHDKKREP
jgi:hypothetical protein